MVKKNHRGIATTTCVANSIRIDTDRLDLVFQANQLAGKVKSDNSKRLEHKNGLDYAAKNESRLWLANQDAGTCSNPLDPRTLKQPVDHLTHSFIAILSLTFNVEIMNERERNWSLNACFTLYSGSPEPCILHVLHIQSTCS